MGFAFAQQENFPDNIFWDLDFLVESVLREGLVRRWKRGGIRERFERMTELQRLYGRGAAIRFRYGHDFIYGYDWAKWRKRTQSDFSKAAGPGPFSLPFLDYLRDRGHELLALIAKDDRKYPTLSEGEQRNPFSFSESRWTSSGFIVRWPQAAISRSRLGRRRLGWIGRSHMRTFEKSGRSRWVYDGMA